MEFGDVVFLLARVLFALLFIGSGVGHLTAADAMGGYAESRGLSNGKQMVQISGVALLAGGVAVLIGFIGDVASIGLFVLLLILAVVMHPYWKETDAQAKQMEMVAFNKDVALAGAALAFFLLFQAAGVVGTGLTVLDTGWGWGLYG